MPSTAVVHELRVSALQQFKPQGTDMRNGRTARVDRALFAFDLDADLSGAFNWNVKQLFVYLAANFQTTTNVRPKMQLPANASPATALTARWYERSHHVKPASFAASSTPPPPSLIPMRARPFRR